MDIFTSCSFIEPFLIYSFDNNIELLGHLNTELNGHQFFFAFVRGRVQHITFFSFLETKQKRTKGDRDEISPLIPQVKLPLSSCTGYDETKPLNYSF